MSYWAVIVGSVIVESFMVRGIDMGCVKIASIIVGIVMVCKLMVISIVELDFA